LAIQVMPHRTLIESVFRLEAQHEIERAWTFNQRVRHERTILLRTTLLFHNVVSRVPDSRGHTHHGKLHFHAAAKHEPAAIYIGLVWIFHMLRQWRPRVIGEGE